ncbi:hypothetical protein D3C78_1366970 [compost metagenome]
MIGATLADIDPLGIATAQLKNRRGHQTVIQHHVRLLHQAQGTEGQQIRITRPCAHQIHLTGRTGRLTVDLGLQQALGFGALSGQLAIGDRPLKHLFPERPTLLDIRKQPFDLVAKTRRQPGQLAIGRRNPGFQLGPDQARQHRRVATAGHRDHQRRTIDDRREDHAAQRRRIHHVDRHATPMSILGDLRIQRLVVGGGNDQPATVEV